MCGLNVLTSKAHFCTRHISEGLFLSCIHFFVTSKIAAYLETSPAFYAVTIDAVGQHLATVVPRYAHVLVRSPTKCQRATYRA